MNSTATSTVTRICRQLLAAVTVSGLGCAAIAYFAAPCIVERAHVSAPSFALQWSGVEPPGDAEIDRIGRCLKQAVANDGVVPLAIERAERRRTLLHIACSDPLADDSAVWSALSSVAAQHTVSELHATGALVRDEALAAIRAAREQLDARSMAFDRALAQLAAAAARAASEPAHAAIPAAPPEPDPLVVDLAQLKLRRQRLAETHTAEHPRLIDLDDRIARLERATPRPQAVAVSSTRAKPDPHRDKQAHIASSSSEVERCRESLSAARTRWIEALDLAALAPPAVEPPRWLPVRFAPSTPAGAPLPARHELASRVWNDAVAVAGLSVACLACLVQVRRAEGPSNFPRPVEPNRGASPPARPIARNGRLAPRRRAGSDAER